MWCHRLVYSAPANQALGEHADELAAGEFVVVAAGKFALPVDLAPKPAVIAITRGRLRNLFSSTRKLILPFTRYIVI